MNIIQGFKPQRVFSFFEQISAIPRGSGNEAAVADYLVQFAQQRGLACTRDANHNVLIKAPATPGREHHAPLLFQGHTDMVCEKNGDVVHDFERDPIRLRLEGNRLMATGTTLGGDDGIAVAMMMALLDGEIESHPAYECLFTTEEETGMGGAIAFDYSLLSAKYMINLDSEQENQITAGCAGGIRSDLVIPTKEQPCQGQALRLSVTGLCGGHSGEDINKGRANANLIMGRLLAALPGARLVEIEGGSKDNAIPRECRATVVVPDADAARAALAALSEDIAGELVAEDGRMRVDVQACDQKYDNAWDEQTTLRVIGALTTAPCGVLAMSRDVAGLVEFSRNLGIVRTQAGGVKITFTSRSSRESRLDATIASLNTLAALLGAEINHHSRYPGWEYSPASALRDAYVEAYRALFDQPVRICAIHAGLECGYMKKQRPELDIISVGPNMQGIHSPDETLFLDSVERVWQTLARLIEHWNVQA